MISSSSDALISSSPISGCYQVKGSGGSGPNEIMIVVFKLLDHFIQVIVADICQILVIEVIVAGNGVQSHVTIMKQRYQNNDDNIYDREKKEKRKRN